MKNQLKYLAVIFLLLVILVAAFEFLKPGPLPAKKRLFSLLPEQVAAFEIRHFIQGLRFQQQEGLWQVKKIKTELAQKLEQEEAAKPAKNAKAKKGAKNAKEPQEEKGFEYAPANSVELTKVLGHLLNLEVTEPVATQTKENLFQIHPYSLQVIFYNQAGEELDGLFVGKSGPEFMSSYVAKKGAKSIYLVDQNFNLLLIRDYEEWVEQEEEKNHDSKKKE